VATADLEASGLSPATADTVRRFAGAVASGGIRLDGSVGLDTLIASVTAIPGIGTTAAHHLALRLGQRDAFPQADPSVLRALRALDPKAEDPAATAEAWRPWRSLAATHLLAHRETTMSASAI
jgi:3-methyladenine DNA glycosylase/8-oxoguanine DNA glycosylase